jgi:hypothetical protein
VASIGTLARKGGKGRIDRRPGQISTGLRNLSKFRWADQLRQRAVIAAGGVITGLIRRVSVFGGFE